jgi:hypothetical protein
VEQPPRAWGMVPVEVILEEAETVCLWKVAKYDGLP